MSLFSPEDEQQIVESLEDPADLVQFFLSVASAEEPAVAPQHFKEDRPVTPAEEVGVFYTMAVAAFMAMQAASRLHANKDDPQRIAQDWQAFSIHSNIVLRLQDAFPETTMGRSGLIRILAALETAPDVPTSL